MRRGVEWARGGKRKEGRGIRSRQILSEKMCFECALECLCGRLLSEVMREGVPLCGCSIFKRTFAVCFGASTWNHEKEIVI